MKLLSGIAAFIAAIAVGAAQAAPLDDLMATVAADPAPLRADIEVLTGADGVASPIVSRSIFHPDLARAERWLIDQLDAIDGLDVSTQTVSVEVSLEGEAVTVDGLLNIIAELPGASDAPAVVLGAHLDSTAKASPGGWDALVDPAPGADDDASGVAALLSMARTLAAWPGGFERPIRFVFFTAEEVGLLGSEHYVDGLLASGDDVEVMLQLDPIGFNGNFDDRLWFAYDGRWPELKARVDEGAADAGTWLAVVGVNAALIGGDDRSDHFHFWEAGWPAVHFGAFPPPPDYHKTTDTLAVVDLDFLAEVTRTLTWLAADLAGVQEAPAVPEAGCACAVTEAPLTPTWLLGSVLGLAWGRRRKRQ